MPERRNKRFLKALALLSALCTMRANADPGLGSLAALIPFYIIALLVLTFLFVVLPLWLVFRAKKKLATGKLTRNKLLLHIAPAGVIGVMGVIDFFTLPSFTFLGVLTQIVGQVSSNPMYSMVVYYIGLLVNLVFIYLVWTTYGRYTDVKTRT